MHVILCGAVRILCLCASLNLLLLGQESRKVVKEHEAKMEKELTEKEAVLPCCSCPVAIVLP